MTQNPKGFKWYVFKKIGNDKKDDVKVSKGLSREWQARIELKRILDNIDDNNKSNSEFYIGKEYV